MKAKHLLAIVAIALLATSCGTVPVTGRQQLNLVSDAEVLQSGLSAYSSFMKTATISSEKTQSEQVTRVGQKIAAATEKYLTENGLAADVKNYAWEFNLVKDDQVNAFCMPGGKIVVYEGLMKLVSCDDDLAVVLGHEVAHAVAKHSNERLSQQMLAEYGGQALSVLTSGKSYSTQQIAQTVYGLGANYAVVLPFSRKHESEADYIGLVLMSMAGYNPDYALNFWQKMSTSGGNKNVPEFMSTHPSDATRIADIQKNLPAVKSKFYVAPATTTTQTTSAKTKRKTTSNSTKSNKSSKQKT
ncbi:MAG: M48 family metallopeptidase [Muribaculaceae bacterium]|nr:M48 family metallopeptidase [Muribaculaceae bacterium]